MSGQAQTPGQAFHGHAACRCEGCDDAGPHWVIERWGDAVITWACDDDLGEICDRLQRDGEVTELSVRDYRKARTAPGSARQARKFAAREPQPAPELAEARFDAEQARDALGIVMAEHRRVRELLDEVGTLAANAPEDGDSFEVCEEIAMRIAAADAEPLPQPAPELAAIEARQGQTSPGWAQLDVLERVIESFARVAYAATIDLIRGEPESALHLLGEQLDGWDGPPWNTAETGMEWLERTRDKPAAGAQRERQPQPAPGDCPSCHGQFYGDCTCREDCGVKHCQAYDPDVSGGGAAARGMPGTGPAEVNAPQPGRPAPELAAAMAEARKVKGALAVVLSLFAKGSDGYRARISQVNLARAYQAAGVPVPPELVKFL